ncbi:unnamed protein product [Diamesa tonsa]
MNSKGLSFVLLFACLIVLTCAGDNKKHDKYSKKNNIPEEKLDPDFRSLQKPFRISKLNLLWSKAVHRLTEPKLKSLFTELKIHDKEELAFKHIKSNGHKNVDSEGLKSAELRKKLIGIMSTYGMLEVLEIDNVNPELLKAHKPMQGKVSENYKNKSMFKDKKLNKLWERAEIGGFASDELEALKEEFQHHEEKVQVYYSLLENLDGMPKKDKSENAVNEDEIDTFNEISLNEDTNDLYEQQKRQSDKHSEYLDQANLVREKHREIRDNIDRLERKTSKGANSTDFIEPKVQGLWRVAMASNFTANELASLKVELLHFESRFLKLRHMTVEHSISMEKYKTGKSGDKNHDEKLQELETKIKKQSRKVEKIQEDLERKLLKHSEL